MKNLELIMTQNKYAMIIKHSSTYMVIDSANQARFATPSELKAKNFLKKLLKAAGESIIKIKI